MKSFWEQVATPFPSSCMHWKKGRGTIRAKVVAVACTWDVAPGLELRGGVKGKGLSSIASGISGPGSCVFGDRWGIKVCLCLRGACPCSAVWVVWLGGFLGLFYFC